MDNVAAIKVVAKFAYQARAKEELSFEEGNHCFFEVFLLYND